MRLGLVALATVCATSRAALHPSIKSQYRPAAADKTSASSESLGEFCDLQFDISFYTN